MYFVKEINVLCALKAQFTFFVPTRLCLNDFIFLCLILGVHKYMKNYRSLFRGGSLMIQTAFDDLFLRAGKSAANRFMQIKLLAFIQSF